ncbi:unnamed protein product [Amoebophrya sp. A25]|nr:unnamed protein product [Amoebophrya sp. A25]|eukprot:GSA25T00014389001.1
MAPPSFKRQKIAPKPSVLSEDKAAAELEKTSPSGKAKDEVDAVADIQEGDDVDDDNEDDDEQEDNSEQEDDEDALGDESDDETDSEVEMERKSKKPPQAAGGGLKGLATAFNRIFGEDKAASTDKKTKGASKKDSESSDEDDSEDASDDEEGAATSDADDEANAKKRKQTATTTKKATGSSTTTKKGDDEENSDEDDDLEERKKTSKKTKQHRPLAEIEKKIEQEAIKRNQEKRLARQLKATESLHARGIQKKPDLIREQTFERSLRSLATRGVVTLFTSMHRLQKKEDIIVGNKKSKFEKKLEYKKLRQQRMEERADQRLFIEDKKKPPTTDHGS